MWKGDAGALRNKQGGGAPASGGMRLAKRARDADQLRAVLPASAKGHLRIGVPGEAPGCWHRSDVLTWARELDDLVFGQRAYLDIC